MIKIIPQGRFGNHLFQNIGFHFVAKKFNMKVESYYSYSGLRSMGINLFSGSNTFGDMETYADEQIMDLLLSDCSERERGILFIGGFQLTDFVLIYKNEIKKLYHQNEKNDGVFVHVRLGDATHVNPGIDYYIKCLDSINFNVGYISSDSPNHEIVRVLCEKYNLKLYNNEVCEIMKFGSSFSNIILSGGTFSWWVGMFADKNSNVFFPIQKQLWHGDIFVFPEWNGIG